ncbi:hypothetical protein [Pseudomonas sp. PSB11]|uniref:hypothetical protein n=1 Tax=Pseudomonas sp. PSB11 TaxID=2021969 RepID=UPI0016605238|nr:hypothetical protein [Pseudomonas sp. PSB11]MBD0679932.1 hypothetical protein [Pseudomonas sp. PSB11]
MDLNHGLPLSDAAPAAPSESDRKCDEARKLFPKELLQYLDCNSAARCQALLGHGDEIGVWKTDESSIGGRHTKIPLVFMRERLVRYLPSEVLHAAELETLLDEGVLTMTRYALLMRMGQSSIRNQGRSLDVTTIAYELYQRLPTIIAQGIKRRLEGVDLGEAGLVRCLNSDDLRSLNSNRYLRVVLRRIAMLADQDLWSDAPIGVFLRKTTSPRGSALPTLKEEKANPFLPIPDDYMAEMGAGVLWLVQDLGPNLIALAESLPKMISGISLKSQAFPKRLQCYFSQNAWCDRKGRPITQPLCRIPAPRHRGGHRAERRGAIDEHDWLPRSWQNVQVLIVTLQSAHLWVALLAMGGRLQEVLTLPRNCVEEKRDGETYVNGKTYKLSRNLAGEDREWPVPDILVEALAQQARLVRACERVAWLREGNDESDEMLIKNNHLWGSFGPGAMARDKQLVCVNNALRRLADRLSMISKPGGRNLHAHRFRKTIARLAALAIVDSPRVLMQLFGHRNITMTLHYILTDKSLQVEIEKVTRELRVMRCQDVLEDLHSAVSERGAPAFGGYGGGALPHMTKTIKIQEEELHRQGLQWSAGSARELAVMLTNNGQYFRMVKPGVLCTKPTREATPCQCSSDCINRIEEKTARRDVIDLVPALIKEGHLALTDRQLLVAANVVEQLDEELARFEDIGAMWRDNPELIALREAVRVK